MTRPTTRRTQLNAMNTKLNLSHAEDRALPTSRLLKLASMNILANDVIFRWARADRAAPADGRRPVEPWLSGRGGGIRRLWCRQESAYCMQKAFYVGLPASGKLAQMPVDAFQYAAAAG